MAYQFSKHYTLEEARALLPTIRKWLGELEHHHQRLETLDKRVGSLLAAGDAGGASVNQLVRTIADFQAVLMRFRLSDIQVKDLSRGLIDFPSLRNGREVFLCWEKDEDSIEYWHDLESGYSGREKL